MTQRGVAMVNTVNSFQKHLIRLIMCCLLVVAINSPVRSQDIFGGKDLSRVKVDLLSTAELQRIKNQISGSGMSMDQLEAMAASKGMPAPEIAKLKQRLALLSVTQPSTETSRNTQDPSVDSLDRAANREIKTKPLINPLIFGSELYTAAAPSFEPGQNLATPVNYILGPKDQVLISVYGVQEYSGEFAVSPEGNISIPNVGLVKIAGMTIEAATQKIKTVMGNSAYPYLKSGAAKLSVTLGGIRSIKITVIGSNRPGNYTVSSLATVFNALYLCGGPSAFGSFREIELIRNNKVERKIDLYRFLLHGDQSDNIGLKDNDLIRIPAYKKRVEFRGQVKREGIFEVLPGESFANILEFASGFTDTAYRTSVKVFQLSDGERKIHDLPVSEFNTYQPESGEIFVISKILNRFRNRVTVKGAVFRPDVYELSPGMRVSDLIRRANGLKEDALTGMAQIFRRQENLVGIIVPFNVKNAMNGDSKDNVLLQREDEVTISSVLELRDSLKITVQGEVRIPGTYEYVENLSLKGLILQAGGFTDAAFAVVEVARLIKRDSILTADNNKSEIFNFTVDVDLNNNSASDNMLLMPFDVVTVRRKAGYTLPESVTVSGQVQYPGPYTLGKQNERISDLLRKAGGFLPEAFPEGAYLKRYQQNADREKTEDLIKKMQKSARDSGNVLLEDTRRKYDKIPLNMEAIKNAPGSIEDIVLQVGDELYIPKFDGQVKISGGVLLSTQIPFQKGKNLENYIAEAGGFSGDAWKRKTYIIYANGKTATAKHFLFFKSYPKVLPGSEIVVPNKPARKTTSSAEIIGLASALASLAGVVIAILNLK